MIGTASANLDTFFTEEETTRYLLEENSRGCEISVMEGVMGYYDGVGGTTTKASAYDLAKVTKTPVVLLVNCKGMSVSILPYIEGFVKYQKDSGIEGVLLNQMSPMLYPRVKKLIEDQLSISVYGYIPPVEECDLKSRHLGLVLPDEIGELREKLNRLAAVLEDTVELDGLLRLGKSAPDLEVRTPDFLITSNMKQEKSPVCIGVSKDEAFCFLYADNLTDSGKNGAKSVIFLLCMRSIFQMIWTGCCSAAAIRSFLERNWKKTKLYGWKSGKNCSRDCLFWQSAEALCICTILLKIWKEISVRVLGT